MTSVEILREQLRGWPDDTAVTIPHDGWLLHITSLHYDDVNNCVVLEWRVDGVLGHENTDAIDSE